MSEPASRSFDVLLPGRTAWLQVCHARPAGCPECRRRIAAFLAAELRWDVMAVLSHQSAYLALFPKGECSVEEANLLGQQVLHACAAPPVCETAGAGKPGTCRYCGCTDVRACMGGCFWIDDDHTVCSTQFFAMHEKNMRRLIRLVRVGAA